MIDSHSHWQCVTCVSVVVRSDELVRRDMDSASIEGLSGASNMVRQYKCTVNHNSPTDRI